MSQTTMPSLFALLPIISSSTLLFLHVFADEGEAVIEERLLQSTTPANSGGQGAGAGGGKSISLPPPQSQVATGGSKNSKGGVNTAGVSKGVAKGGKRKKGGHRKMVSEFLKAHNEVRAKYSEPPLRWNNTLERYAQQWAALRADDCQLAHAPNNQYGENLFWGKYRHWTPRQVVKQWADEVAFYNSKNYSCVEGQQCGHYTQIVWRSSSWVGCAKQICLNGEVFVVCEYFPAGNYLDTPDPFTAQPSYTGEENNIPQSAGHDVTNVATTTKAKSTAKPTVRMKKSATSSASPRVGGTSPAQQN